MMPGSSDDVAEKNDDDDDERRHRRPIDEKALGIPPLSSATFSTRPTTSIKHTSGSLSKSSFEGTAGMIKSSSRTPSGEEEAAIVSSKFSSSSQDQRSLLLLLLRFK